MNTIRFSTRRQKSCSGTSRIVTSSRKCSNTRANSSTGVCDHLAEIDAHIQSAASEWPLQQMARIDKNILRLAIYEILFNNTVPAKAAINEAVELAKQFGSNTSSRFVNGVLGTIFHRAQQSPTPIAESEVK